MSRTVKATCEAPVNNGIVRILSAFGLRLMAIRARPFALFVFVEVLPDPVRAVGGGHEDPPSMVVQLLVLM